MIRVGFRWLERGSCSHPEIMTLSGGSLCPVDFPALVGVIEHPERGVFLFDTGYDPAFHEATAPFPERFYRWTTPVAISEAQQWQNWLRSHSIDEQTIAGTIVSHFHGDHVAGLRHLAHKPVFCARAGLSELREKGRIARVRKGLLSQLVPSEADANAIFFEDAPALPLPIAFAPFCRRPRYPWGWKSAGRRTARPLHRALGAGLHDGGRATGAAGCRCSMVWPINPGKSPPPRITTALLGDTRKYRATLNLLSAAAHANCELAILPSHCRTSARAFSKDDAT